MEHWSNVGPTVSQGSSEGAIISAVNLDNGISEEFHEENEDDEEEEKEDEKNSSMGSVKYEDVVIHPLLFQDDVWNAAEKVDDAQKANKKIEEVLEKKITKSELG